MGDEPTIPPAGQTAESGEQSSYLVVGVGASAGGITALQRFLSQVAPDSGLAYIVILHLSPLHASSLAEVLQGATKIRVTQVTETAKIQPNHVYVNPPAKYMVVDDGCLKLIDPEAAFGNLH